MVTFVWGWSRCFWILTPPFSFTTCFLNLHPQTWSKSSNHCKTPVDFSWRFGQQVVSKWWLCIYAKICPDFVALSLGYFNKVSAIWSVLHTVNSATYIYTLLWYTLLISLPLFFTPVASEEAIMKRYSVADVSGNGTRKRQLQFYSSSSSLHLQSIFPAKGTPQILLKGAPKQVVANICLRDNTVSVLLLAVQLCAATLR